MKKYIIIALSLIALTVNADSKTIGRMSTVTGATTSMSIMDSNGNKYVFMYVRGKYGVRKASLVMSKSEAVRLRDLLDKAIQNID